MIELEDNQLIICRLYYWDDQEEKFEFISYRDPFPRNGGEVSGDPIVKIRYVIDSKDYFHGAALRQSGNVDLYYNY
jgi:hypothetical protein